MGTVQTSSASTATAYGNQRKIDRCQNGVLWAAVCDNQNGVQLQYSTDSGATWKFGDGFGTVGSNYTFNGSLFIDLDDYAHFTYKQSSDGLIYYRRGTPNAARTSYTWSAATVVYNADANRDFPDLVVCRDPATVGAWVGLIVYGTVAGTNGTVKAFGRSLAISSAGVVTVGAETFISAAIATTNANPGYAGVDFNHTGDGKTVAGGTPHWYVGWSAGATGAGYGIRFRKATYSSGSWTWGTEREIDNTRYCPAATSGYWISTLFDGSRVMIAASAFVASTSNQRVSLYERDAADTTTTTRVDAANSSTEALNFGSHTYDPQGNVYIFASDGSSPTRLLSRRWNRSTTTYESPTVIAASGVGQPYVSARRGYQGQAIDYVWTSGTASPYTVTSGRTVLNSPPNASPLTSPANNATIDDTIVQQLAWTFSDPDAGDSQSKFDLQYRVQGTSTWTTVTQSTPNSYWNAPAGTFTQGSTYEWQVRTYDSTGTQGPWSSSSFFTAQAPPATPTITSPMSGSTISASSAQVAWSEPNQDTYQVRVVADDGAGNPVTSSVVWDSGAISQAYVRVQQVPFATNNVTQHVQVRVQYQGLWSAWADARVLVSYTPPASPTLSLIPQQASASLAVVYSQPAPGSGQPAVAYVDISIDDGPSPTGQASPGLTRRATQLPAQGTWTYYTPRAGWDYTGGRVRVTSVATNGTSTSVTS